MLRTAAKETFRLKELKELLFCLFLLVHLFVDSCAYSFKIWQTSVPLEVISLFQKYYLLKIAK